MAGESNESRTTKGVWGNSLSTHTNILPRASTRLQQPGAPYIQSRNTTHLHPKHPFNVPRDRNDNQSTESSKSATDCRAATVRESDKSHSHQPSTTSGHNAGADNNAATISAEHTTTTTDTATEYSTTTNWPTTTEPGAIPGSRSNANQPEQCEFIRTIEDDDTDTVNSVHIHDTPVIVRVDIVVDSIEDSLL